MNTLLDTLAGKGTGVYRLVSSVLLSALTISVVLIGWFAKDELQLFRDTQAGIVAEIKNHIGADIESRGTVDQRVQTLDLRVTKADQSRDDVIQQIIANQSVTSQQIQLVENALVSVERELSQIEGKLSILPSSPPKVPR